MLLISTYELGRQPFGLASPAAWLRAAGHDVTLADVSRQPTAGARRVEAADLIAFFLPMHTATRLFLRAGGAGARRRIRGAHLCGYGLYAPLNERAAARRRRRHDPRRRVRAGLVDLAGAWRRTRAAAASRAADFARPAAVPGARPRGPAAAGRVRATRGRRTARAASATPRRRAAASICAGIARSCRYISGAVPRRAARGGAGGHPPAGGGRRRSTSRSAIPISSTARGTRWRSSKRSTREWPGLTYDVTIKIEHLLQHRDLLPVLQRTGCAVRDQRGGVARRRGAGEAATRATRARISWRRSRLMRAIGLPLAPTFIPFTPWTTLESYRAFLRDAGGSRTWRTQVAPIQLAIRLLIPEGSLLLELPEVRAMVEPFDARALCLSVAQSRPGAGRAVRADSGDDQARGEAPHARARRSSGRSGIWRRRGEFPDLPLAVARDDSVSDRALVLLSGAHGRAVSSCVNRLLACTAEFVSNDASQSRLQWFLLLTYEGA